MTALENKLYNMASFSMKKAAAAGKRRRVVSSRRPLKPTYSLRDENFSLKMKFIHDITPIIVICVNSARAKST